jgi:outer membrane protein assembly factor BamA
MYRGSHHIKSFLVITLFILSLYSCSTVRVLKDNENLLKENKIVVLNSNEVKPGELTPYLRQQPNKSLFFGWNPFLMIYNWSSGKENGWDRFVKKVGQQPVILDTNLLNRSRENLVNHLTSLGYYNSTVSDTIITKRKKSRVFYKVSIGTSYKVTNILYDIKDDAIKDIIEAHYPASSLFVGMRLSEKSLDKESERVTNILRDNGYYNFTKNFFFFEADTLNTLQEADLYIRVDNYTRNETLKDSRPHEVFRIRKISLYPDYDPMISRDDSLTVYDKESIQSVDIYRRGERTIRSSVLGKLNTLRKGDLYSEKMANITYNRFVGLRYFSGVNIQFDEVVANRDKDFREVDCIIRLTPSKSQGYKFNLEASSNSNNLLGVSPAVSYYHKNLFKGGEWFTLGFMGNFQFKLKDPIRSTELGISTGISIPSFLLLPDSLFKTNLPRTDLNVGYNYQSRPEFTRNLISFNYGYNWRVGERFFYIINPLQLNIVRLFNMNPLFYDSLLDPFLKNAYKNHFDLGSGVTFYYTTDASSIPKRSFFYLRWSNDISGNLLSMFDSTLSSDSTGAKMVWNTPYAQYVKTDFTLGYTWKNSTTARALATRFNIGIGHAYGNSRSLPFEKLFYSGGANSLRGWQARSVGPGSAAIDSTFIIPNQTGDLKLELNAEYRFNLFWNVEGAIFMDAGNIWTLKSEQGRESGVFRLRDFYKSTALNWGAGVRLNLEFVILRLDLGMIAHDPSKKKWISPSEWFKTGTYSLQFGVGYPF